MSEEKQKRPYREGDEPVKEVAEDEYEDNRRSVREEDVETAVLLLLTPHGVDVVVDIQGVPSKRRANMHDIRDMTGSVHDEASGNIIAEKTSGLVAQKVMHGIQMNMASKGPLVTPDGVPIIGRRGGPHGPQ